MILFIAIAALGGGVALWVYNWATELNGRPIPELQAEWLGYYNNFEATLLKADPKVYHEDIAKAALIFSGATYEKPLNGFEGCLPDFKINT